MQHMPSVHDIAVNMLPNRTVAVFGTDNWVRHLCASDMIKQSNFVPTNIAVVTKNDIWPDQYAKFDHNDSGGLDKFVAEHPHALVVWDCYYVQQPAGWQDLHHKTSQLVLCSHTRGAATVVQNADTVVTYAWPASEDHWDPRETLFHYKFRHQYTNLDLFIADLDQLAYTKYLVANIDNIDNIDNNHSSGK